ncbi:hypothetical protein EEL36_08750 [Muribaculaceae bacterium Isolate-043 (Harlan)]|nr:hypothetical protein EEL36_08750 [Muribaculaceae bacterium Isolate-043 (Harlan)]
METDNTGKNEGARMVASAIVGLDYRIIVVNDKSYIIHPPTIAKIAGATYWLCEAGDGKTLREILVSLSKSENLTKALSWFIQGNEDLGEELTKGTLDEIVNGIEAAFSMIEAQNFMKLSALQKSASLLVAKPK